MRALSLSIPPIELVAILKWQKNREGEISTKQNPSLLKMSTQRGMPSYGELATGVANKAAFDASTVPNTLNTFLY